ncbi:hypothetical protein MMC10_001843 [Thelotrema lepadinum]|nr:hypothetical protein [Thelotrema lepadinum]
MHSISRKFTIPRFSISSGSRLESDTPLDITLLEPSLTGDNLGHKTWCASYLLSMRLQDLRSFLKASGSKAGVRVLELGGGTGLLGLAFGSLFPNTAIDLTDLPGIVPNLADNVAANRHLLEQVGSSASVFALDWAHAVAKQDDERYHIVLAADPIYSPSHPALLANAVGLNLLRTAEARLVIGLPTRDAYTPEVEDLRSRLDAMGLLLVKDGEEVGVDDWEGHGGRRTEVRCWWGVWKWQLV